MTPDAHPEAPMCSMQCGGTENTTLSYFPEFESKGTRRECQRFHRNLSRESSGVLTRGGPGLFEWVCLITGHGYPNAGEGRQRLAEASRCETLTRSPL